MLIATSLDQQYNRARDDDLRVLVVGAGIAGVTAAQLLRRTGRHPVLIERDHSGSESGYMLALMPMAVRALDSLGVHDRYRAASVPLERYAIDSHVGRRLRVDSLTEVLSRFGDYRGIARGDLIEVLSADGCDVSFGATVDTIADKPGGVEAVVVDDMGVHRLTFDLVIAADGMHSSTRALVHPEGSVEELDTQWGGWVVWTPQDADADLVEEVWGAGFFLGTYPVAGKLGVFLGGPRADTRAGAASFAATIRQRLKIANGRLDRAMSAVVDDADPYYWSLTDCRATGWAGRRSVLLGDAAAGFLPTAGVGAGMAMESAWVLAHLLQRADRAGLADILQVYERAQRPRVEMAQRNSRHLAKLMFQRSAAVAAARDVALRVTSVQRALRPITRLLDQQPDPDTFV